jgi:hypothetical protein
MSQCCLIGEDKSPILVNDDNRDAYTVQNGLKETWRLKTQ